MFAMVHSGVRSGGRIHSVLAWVHSGASRGFPVHSGSNVCSQERD